MAYTALQNSPLQGSEDLEAIYAAWVLQRASQTFYGEKCVSVKGGVGGGGNC